MNTIIRRQLAQSKRRIERRLDKTDLRGGSKPMFTARNIHYQIAERSRGMGCGGIGAFHLLARRIGLVEEIDRRLNLLKVHLPYHESDHVLNFAYNALCGGTCLQDLELRRNDEVFLDALGTRRIPDPTTAGDFCRRFTRQSIKMLLEIIDEARLRVWAMQPAAFFEQATIDMDGHLVATEGECKRGMDIAYDGTWGYHPLLLTLAETGELLSVVNRSGNRPSHEGAAEQVDRALGVCFRGGFRRVLLRGDTDFSQTEHLDGWDGDPRVRFVFGFDAAANLKEIAEDLPAGTWKVLERPARYEVPTRPRLRPDKVKAKIVAQRGYENLRLRFEEVAEFEYQPVACKRSYRMVVVRKNISREKGEQVLFDEIKYFFYITNERQGPAAAIVFSANDRCNQENHIEQLSNAVRSLRAPVDSLESNWAYMVMTGLAWNLKAWWALLLPEGGRWAQKHRAEKQRVLKLEFKTFVNAFVRLPCQIIRTARKVIYRLLSYSPWHYLLFRVLPRLRC